MNIFIGKLLLFLGCVGVILTPIFVMPFTPSQMHESRLTEMESMDEIKWKERFGDKDRSEILKGMNQSILETKKAEKESHIALAVSILIAVVGLTIWKLAPNQSR